MTEAPRSAARKLLPILALFLCCGLPLLLVVGGYLAIIVFSSGKALWLILTAVFVFSLLLYVMKRRRRGNR